MTSYKVKKRLDNIDIKTSKIFNQNIEPIIQLEFINDNDFIYVLNICKYNKKDLKIDYNNCDKWEDHPHYRYPKIYLKNVIEQYKTDNLEDLKQLIIKLAVKYGYDTKAIKDDPLNNLVYNNLTNEQMHKFIDINGGIPFLSVFNYLIHEVITNPTEYNRD